MVSLSIVFNGRGAGIDDSKKMLCPIQSTTGPPGQINAERRIQKLINTDERVPIY